MIQQTFPVENMSFTTDAHSNSLLFTLATRIAQQTPYSFDQALLGVQGLLSCYDDENAVNTAVTELIGCLRQK